VAELNHSSVTAVQDGRAFSPDRRMHKYLDSYPPAPLERIEEAKRLFPYRQMPADEYAAREGVVWVWFAFGEYRYPDPTLNEWIHTLDDILFTPGLLAEAQQKYTSREAGAQASGEMQG
jgi:hypothetical protein